MRVTIVSAGTQTGKATIQHLIESNDGVQIHALYRNLDKVPNEFKSVANFTAAQGDVEDPSSLDFSSSTSVLAMTPPIYKDVDVLAHAEQMCVNIKNAIDAAGTVKRLVLLSSTGAEFEKGVGEVMTNNIAERVLKTANVSEMIFVRCAYFMENWTITTETLKGPNPFFQCIVTPLDYKIPMVSVKDIGINLAMALTSTYTPPVKPYVFELQGPEYYTPLDVQNAFSKALKIEVELRAVEKDGIRDFFTQFCPPAIAGLYEEVTLAFLPGGVMATDSDKTDKLHIVKGKTTLDEAIATALNK